MDYFLNLYGELPRAGPGDDSSTRRAFEMIEGLPKEPRVLDIGCGPGAQTLELARLTRGRIVALDLMPRMLERLSKAAAEQGFEERVSTIELDMNRMDFPPGTFDLIWAEGSIYLMGFKSGLRKVRKFVKRGGCVAVSEAVWLKPDPPDEVRELWKEYPEIDSIEQKLAVIEEAGYESVGHFVLAPTSWTEGYYDPMLARVQELQHEWEAIPEASKVLEEALYEIDVFRRFHEYYGYCFFVMQMP
jgi:SAM-dependent methyltransferase